MEEIEIRSGGDDLRDTFNRLEPSDWRWVREALMLAMGEIASDMEKELPEGSSLDDVAADVIGNFLGACAYTIRSVEESEGMLLGEVIREVQDRVQDECGKIVGGIDGLGVPNLLGGHRILALGDEGLQEMVEHVCSAALDDVERSIALDGIGVIPKWVKGSAVIKRLCEQHGVTGVGAAVVAACGPLVLRSIYRDEKINRVFLSVMWAFYEFLRKSGMVFGIGRVGEA